MTIINILFSSSQPGEILKFVIKPKLYFPKVLKYIIEKYWQNLCIWDCALVFWARNVWASLRQFPVSIPVILNIIPLGEKWALTSDQNVVEARFKKRFNVIPLTPFFICIYFLWKSLYIPFFPFCCHYWENIINLPQMLLFQQKNANFIWIFHLSPTQHWVNFV